MRVLCRQLRGRKVKTAFSLLTKQWPRFALATFRWLQFLNAHFFGLCANAGEGGGTLMSDVCKSKLLNTAAPPTCCSPEHKPLSCHGNQVPCGSTAARIAPACAVQSKQTPGVGTVFFFFPFIRLVREFQNSYWHNANVPQLFFNNRHAGVERLRRLHPSRNFTCVSSTSRHICVTSAPSRRRVKL